VTSGLRMSTVSAGVAFLAVALAVTLAISALGGAVPGARIADAPFSVSLSATPSYGAPPLSVAFQATVSSGTPTLYQWSFGDGATYNGSNASAADPSHVYASPGDYTATIVVTESSGSNSSSIAIHVVARALTASAVASAAHGPAPLTETFEATVSGGSGTYVNFSWTFGDGGSGEGNPVQYTYRDPGTYHVRFEVFDSGNASANASVWVNVSSAAATPGGASPGLASVLPWAVGGALIGALAVWSVARYRARPRVGPALAPATGAAAPEPEASVAPGDAPAGPPPVVQPSDASARAPSPPEGALRVSQRVILHLAQQGWLGDDEVASVPFTQGGMSEALGIPQTSLTNVLRRLAAAGVVSQDVRHVRGRDRRLKVYRLTPKGQALARDLAHPRR